jgi:two-component system, NtrC family, nitrogen regulation response regulator GlnG
MDGTILVADDDRTIRTVLTQALTRAGCKVHATSSLTTLMRWVEEGRGDVVVSDVKMPDGNGLEMLPRIRELRADLPVIIISAQNTIMTAIQAAEADAFDYLPKPFDLPDLMQRVSRALQTRTMMATIDDSSVATPEELPLVGKTPVMQNLYRTVASVVNTDLPVLISGASGTGKSLIARTTHDLSDRRTLPFVTVSPHDLESIDGPAKVLARAKGGTILFDEVGDLSSEAQGKLVRMFDGFKEYTPRFMATSQGDLGKAMDRGEFREDLFYRLSGVSISVPSLRERVEDIPLLVEFFLGRNEKDGQRPYSVSPDAMVLLRKYSWPGNVRQLENFVLRLASTARESIISRGEAENILSNQPAIREHLEGGDQARLMDSVRRHLQRYFDLHGGEHPPPGLYQRILAELEIPLIEISLEATAGNQAKCAELLGINRNTLRKKITDLGIEVTRRRKLM